MLFVSHLKHIDGTSELLTANLQYKQRPYICSYLISTDCYNILRILNVFWMTMAQTHVGYTDYTGLWDKVIDGFDIQKSVLAFKSVVF